MAGNKSKILDALEAESKAGGQGMLRMIGALLVLVEGIQELAFLKFLPVNLPLSLLLLCVCFCPSLCD